MVSRKPSQFIKMNIGNQKKDKQMRFYTLFLYLIHIIDLHITLLRISLKCLIQIMFQDLKASNLKTVSDNDQTLRNY